MTDKPCITIRSAVQLLGEAKIGKSSFLNYLRDGTLNSNIFTDHNTIKIPRQYWRSITETVLTKRIRFLDYTIEFHDLKAYFEDDLLKIARWMSQANPEAAPEKLQILQAWLEKTISPPLLQTDAVGRNAAIVAELGKLLGQSGVKFPVQVTQSSIDRLKASIAAKSHPGRPALPGKDSMWEALILRIVSSDTYPSKNSIKKILMKEYDKLPAKDKDGTKNNPQLGESYFADRSEKLYAILKRFPKIPPKK